MVIAYVPLLVAVIGLLIFVLAANGKLQKVGEHMLWTGLLVTLFSAAQRLVHLP